MLRFLLRSCRSAVDQILKRRNEDASVRSPRRRLPCDRFDRHDRDREDVAPSSVGSPLSCQSYQSLLTSTPVYGEAYGPVIAFAPGTQTTVGSGVAVASGVAVDGAGNVFIVDSNNVQVVKVSPDGTQTAVGTGLNQPRDVAVDATGSSR